MSNSIKETLQAILDEASEKIEQSDALDKLNDVRVNFLGKKGQLTSVLKGMKDVAPEDRPKVGQMVNEARAKIETMMEESTVIYMERPLRKAEYTIHIEVPPNPFWASVGLSIDGRPCRRGRRRGPAALPRGLCSPYRPTPAGRSPWWRRR